MALIFGGQGHAQSRYAGYAWTCSLDALDDGTLVCALAAEYRRFITDVVAQSTTATAGQVNLFYGTGTNCATGETQLFPPIGGAASTRFAAGGNTAKPTDVSFVSPLIVPSGKDLCALGDAGNPVTIQVSGYLAP